MMDPRESRRLVISMDRQSFLVQMSQFTAFALHNLAQQGQLKIKTIQITEIVKETRRYAGNWFDQQIEA